MWELVSQAGQRCTYTQDYQTKELLGTCSNERDFIYPGFIAIVFKSGLDYYSVAHNILRHSFSSDSHAHPKVTFMVTDDNPKVSMKSLITQQGSRLSACYKGIRVSMHGKLEYLMSD
jgi:hypothetical protein